MTAQHPSSYIFSNAVKIFIGKKAVSAEGKEETEARSYGGGEETPWGQGRQQSLLQTGRSGSGLFVLHEHKNAIDKAEMIYHYLREQLYKHTFMGNKQNWFCWSKQFSATKNLFFKPSL